ncbi:hypothetical protein [Azospirillum canadense]|uniref:hypothetical protein n=1 Tax=Azospirillum canadense TaxID=403962 RepID=UPI0022266084|nr:hypothetical protein [Azospirillum canadense]MCW2239498.1 putative ABC-type sugar transport system permease subunit [Azospirillum canadense]
MREIMAILIALSVLNGGAGGQMDAGRMLGSAAQAGGAWTISAISSMRTIGSFGDGRTTGAGAARAGKFGW